jgi:hypothetical protein
MAAKDNQNAQQKITKETRTAKYPNYTNMKAKEWEDCCVMRSACSERAKLEQINICCGHAIVLRNLPTPHPIPLPVEGRG